MKLDPSAFVADADLLDAFEKRSTSVVCDQDRVLFRQGDEPTGLYVLRSGSATLTMTSPIGEVILKTAVIPGSLLGLPGFIGGQPYSLTANVAKGARLGYINRDDFADLMLKNPALSIKVLSVLAAEVRSARSAISQV